MNCGCGRLACTSVSSQSRPRQHEVRYPQTRARRRAEEHQVHLETTPRDPNRTREKRARRGVPGMTLCRQDLAATLRLRTMSMPGNPGTRPRDRDVVVVNDAKGSLINGHPIVRSGRGGRRPLASASKIGCSSSEGGRRRPSSAVAALPVSHRTTALLVRRWVAGGGSEGRRSPSRPQRFNLAMTEIIFPVREYERHLLRFVMLP